MNITYSIIGGIIITIISSLLTYFITTIAYRKLHTNICKSMLATHVEIHHKHAIEDVVEEHKTSCTASKKFEKIEKSLIYIIGQLGSDAKELGLLE